MFWENATKTIQDTKKCKRSQLFEAEAFTSESTKLPQNLQNCVKNYDGGHEFGPDPLTLALFSFSFA